MAWNGPVNGDWSHVDFTKPPWVSGIAELTHDEVVFAKDQFAIIAVGHEEDDCYIQSTFNQSTNYEKAVNGETYFCIKQYDPEVNTLGINASGIVVPVQPEEPTPTEGV
jgi:hypothetical protein